MKAAFLRGEKLAIFTTTQSDVEGLARALKKLHPEAKGLLVHGGLGLEERRPSATLPLHKAQKISNKTATRCGLYS